MYSRFSEQALRWARVTPQPEPPLGAPGSVRTFRAGPNHYYIRLLRWGIGQIGAAIGIFLFSIGFTQGMQRVSESAVTARDAPRAAASPSPVATPLPTESPAPTVAPEASTAALAAGLSAPSAPSPSASRTPTSRRVRNRSAEGFRRAITRMPRWVVDLAVGWFIPFLVFLEYLGVVTFLFQLPLTYALVRIEFEQHWYVVTDRSLRIRTGVLSLTESTMSFANLQQVEVKQGPIQRLLGLADVRVRSAGGGGSDEGGEHDGEGLHTGSFHNVENADEIRDLIVARLRAFREAGLGDPDHSEEPATPLATGTMSPEALIAAREVLREARALRLATTNGPAG